MSLAEAPLRRLGVFGGAFDPPHLAHRALAQVALDQLALDRLLVVPTGVAWHKRRPLSEAVHRVAMARLAFDGMSGVQVDTREVERAGPSYTVDTLRALRLQHAQAQLYLVIGQDQAQALPGWHAWEEIVALAVIAVAGRGAAHAGAAPAWQPPDALRARFVQLQLPPFDLSATDIRRRAGLGESVEPLVGGPVARYIALHRLYQTS